MDQVFEGLADFFKVETLRQFQKDCLLTLLGSSDVFVSYSTGSGKSLCYECYPMLCWLNATTEDVLVLVVEPLLSIMAEQVKRLTSLGYSATQIGKEDIEHEDVINGKFTFMFGSPELFLGSDEWRSMLRTPCYQQKRVLIVIDEAHTVIEW
jgi:superfamily II DNA helicase RecQ